MPAYKLAALKARFPETRFVNLNFEVDYDNSLPLPLILPLPLALTLTRRCRAPTSPAARAWSTLVASSGGPGLDPNPQDERCPQP